MQYNKSYESSSCFSIGKRKVFFFFFYYLIVFKTYFVSVFRCKWSFKYHKSFLFRGKNKDTANANSCQPWIKTNEDGFDLESGTDGIWGGMARVGDSVAVASHVNRDWVAQRSNCWKKNGKENCEFRILILSTAHFLIYVPHCLERRKLSYLC